MWVIIFFSPICFYLLVNAYKIEKKLKKNLYFAWIPIEKWFFKKTESKMSQKVLKKSSLSHFPKNCFLICALNHLFKKKYFTSIWKRSLKCNKQIKNYSSKSCIDGCYILRELFFWVCQKKVLGVTKMPIKRTLLFPWTPFCCQKLCRELVELIKKVCLNVSNIFWDIGILVGYQTYGAPGIHFLYFFNCVKDLKSLLGGAFRNDNKKLHLRLLLNFTTRCKKHFIFNALINASDINLSYYSVKSNDTNCGHVTKYLI